MELHLAHIYLPDQERLPLTPNVYPMPIDIEPPEIRREIIRDLASSNVGNLIPMAPHRPGAHRLVLSSISGSVPSKEEVPALIIAIRAKIPHRN